MGAGMRPPRRMKSALDSVWTGMTGALPSRPPKLDGVAHVHAGRGDYAHGGGLLVYHAYGGLVGDDGA